MLHCRPGVQIADELLPLPGTFYFKHRCGHFFKREWDVLVLFIYILSFRVPVRAYYIKKEVIHNSVDSGRTPERSITPYSNMRTRLSHPFYFFIEIIKI